jgi:hypothetical protein
LPALFSVILERNQCPIRSVVDESPSYLVIKETKILRVLNKDKKTEKREA